MRDEDEGHGAPLLQILHLLLGQNSTAMKLSVDYRWDSGEAWLASALDSHLSLALLKEGICSETSAAKQNTLNSQTKRTSEETQFQLLFIFILSTTLKWPSSRCLVTGGHRLLTLSSQDQNEITIKLFSTLHIAAQSHYVHVN